MVVDEDESARVETDGIAIELADTDQRRRDVALVDRRDAEHDVLRVEQHDAQLFALEAPHLEDEPVSDISRRADRLAACRPGGEQPPAELERRGELRGARSPNAGNRLELDVR